MSRTETTTLAIVEDGMFEDGTFEGTVLAEPCLLFLDGDDAPAGPCAACGWLAEEHDVAPTVVTVLAGANRRGRSRRSPQRLAS